MNPGEKIKQWAERTREFYFAVRSEMKKVSWPGRQEVISTTLVVIIAVVFFGAYLGVVDVLLGKSVQAVLNYFNVSG